MRDARSEKGIELNSSLVKKWERRAAYLGKLGAQFLLELSQFSANQLGETVKKSAAEQLAVNERI